MFFFSVCDIKGWTRQQNLGKRKNNQLSRSSWMAPWAIWHRRSCPCSLKTSWTRWRLNIPSNPSHCMILWLYETRRCPGCESEDWECANMWWVVLHNVYHITPGSGS